MKPLILLSLIILFLALVPSVEAKAPGYTLTVPVGGGLIVHIFPPAGLGPVYWRTFYVSDACPGGCWSRYTEHIGQPIVVPADDFIMLDDWEPIRNVEFQALHPFAAFDMLTEGIPWQNYLPDAWA